jgi:recombination protein RecR
MPALPEPIARAAAAFDRLPGLGPRAALRYVYWLMTQPKETLLGFARSLEQLAGAMRHCESCHQWAEASPCTICRDTHRDTRVLCIVATSQDLRSIEETGAFKGRYHVLNGTIDPLEGRTPETLTVSALLKRLNEKTRPEEVILALDADIPGDTTSLYLRKQLEPLGIRVTRLARGLPTGAALEYADPLTLTEALSHRS